MNNESNNYAIILTACFSMACGLLTLPQVSAEEVVLEETIVTARRREESLQETPIAVTAFNSNTLEEMGVTSIDGIAKAVPNLNLTSSVGYAVNGVINIRGTAQRGNNLSRDTSVGVYMDGVPISKTTGAIFDAVDLERVEVLRGPQGTLYGKNTIGGAINLITKDPGEEFGGKVTGGVGNESLKTLRATMDTGSIGAAGEGMGQLSARFSGFARQRDGFYTNSGPASSDFDDRDQWGARAALLWDVTDNFQAEYSFDYFTMEQTPPMLQVVNGLGGASENDRPDEIANDAPLRSDLDVQGHALILTYDFPATSMGDLTLKSITARREFSNDSRTDFDGTSDDLFRFTSVNDFEQISQEIQLLGSTDRVQWVAGLFFFADEWETDNPRWIFQFGGNNFDTDFRASEEDSFAAFGQATWTPPGFNDKLDITLGLRYTKENKEVFRRRIDISAFADPAVGPCADAGGVYLRQADGCPVLDASGNVQQLSADDSWSEVTPMGTVSWHFNESVNAYAKVVSGFKSGGFNGVASSNVSFEVPFDPETMTTYELGLKSRLLENKLQLNAAWFFNDFQDVQIEIFVPELLGRTVLNAGEAEMQGVELELTARPSSNWDLAFNLAWLDTEYKVYIENGVDVAADRVFPYSPEYTYGAMVKYLFDPFEFGQLSARLDYSWKDDHYIGIEESPGEDIEAYGLLDARISLEDIPVGNGALKLSAWGKNLLDEEYWEIALNLRVFTVAQWADPRSFGLELSYEF